MCLKLGCCDKNTYISISNHLTADEFSENPRISFPRNQHWPCRDIWSKVCPLCLHNTITIHVDLMSALNSPLHLLGETPYNDKVWTVQQHKQRASQRTWRAHAPEVSPEYVARDCCVTAGRLGTSYCPQFALRPGERVAAVANVRLVLWTFAATTVHARRTRARHVNDAARTTGESRRALARVRADRC